MVDYIVRFIIIAFLALFGWIIGGGFELVVFGEDGLYDSSGYMSAISVALPLCYIFWTIHRETVEKLKIYGHKIKVLEKKLENIDEKNT